MKRSLMLAFAGMLSVLFAASAYAQGVSAHGAGVVAGMVCDSTGVMCDSGGKGIKFNFDFSGTGTGAVPVTGTLSASEGDTGMQIEFAGSGVVETNSHSMFASGVCDVTTPTSTTMPGDCSLGASDNTPNGRRDSVSVFAVAANGFMSAGGELASGNINIE